MLRDGLLTRDGAGPGQRATYRLTEQAIRLVPVLARSARGDCGIGRRRPGRGCGPSLRTAYEMAG